MAVRKTEPGLIRLFGDDGKVRSWRAVVDLGTGRSDRQQLRRTFRTLEEARNWRAEMLSKRAAGTLVLPTKATVSELLETWMLGARHLRPSTRYGYEIHLKPVHDQLGATLVQKLTKRHVENLVEYLPTTGGKDGKGRAPSIVRQSLIILEKAIDDAVSQGHVVRNVARLVQKPRLQRREMTTWSAAQLAVFLREANADRYACLWRVSAYGLRRSEVVGLRWSDVDFERSDIRIYQTRVAVDGKVVAAGEPKTARGRRTIPVDALTLDSLRAFKRKQAREKLSAGQAHADTDLVAVDELGCPIRPEMFGHRFAKITKAAGLPVIRLHDLRHTAASLMHDSGTVSLRTLAAMLGHADPAFTLRTYAHSSDEAMQTASTALASLFSSGH